MSIICLHHGILELSYHVMIPRCNYVVESKCTRAYEPVNMQQAEAAFQIEI